MRRRHYLATVGAVTLGSTAGCSGVQRAVENRQAASGFDFPPGVSAGGVSDSSKLIASHHEQIHGATFTAEFVDRSENHFVGDDEGRIRSAGTPDYTRWDVDHRISPHTAIYGDENVRYLERDGEKRDELYVGDDPGGTGNPFAQAVADSVATRLRDALDAPYGSGDLDIETQDGTDVAVFETTEASARSVDAVDTLELAVDEHGLIRRLHAKYTPRGSVTNREHHYTIDLGATPPAALAGIPEPARALPTFGVAWRDDDRIMELTNTGGGPVRGDAGFLVRNLTITDGAWGDGIAFEPPFEPGETRCLVDQDGPTLTDDPPSNPTTALRTDTPPFFRYENRSDDGNGPIRVEYSSTCSTLDCT